MQIKMADFLYRRAKMSGKKIDELMELWACTLDNDHDPPFHRHTHLYESIDSIKNGEVPWQHSGHAGSITDAYCNGSVERLSKRAERWGELMEAVHEYAAEKLSRSRSHKVVYKASSSRVIADSSSPTHPE